MSSLIAHRKNVYSQNGEDGVVAEIVRRLGISKGWFCEFGAWDGRYGSNTFALLRKGWRGVMIEGDSNRFRDLEKTAARFPGTLEIMEAFVSAGHDDSSLDSLLARTPIPADFDILSIDIDGSDYHVWQSFKGYRPKLVIIEIDSSTPPGEDYIFRGGSRLTSFSAMLKLGRAKGYTLVCHTGNLFFVRNDLIGRLSIDPHVLGDPDSLFIADWVEPTFAKTWQRKIRNLTWQRVLAKVSVAMRGPD
jgi:hypothetical protein